LDLKLGLPIISELSIEPLELGLALLI
jgi:hypothetical protein